VRIAEASAREKGGEGGKRAATRRGGRGGKEEERGEKQMFRVLKPTLIDFLSSSFLAIDLPRR